MNLQVKPHPEFEEPANAPDTTCNGCGETKPPKYVGLVGKWDDGDFSVAACSEACKRKLFNNPNGLLYMLEDVLHKLGHNFSARKFIMENNRSN